MIHDMNPITESFIFFSDSGNSDTYGDSQSPLEILSNIILFGVLPMLCLGKQSIMSREII